MAEAKKTEREGSSMTLHFPSEITIQAKKIDESHWSLHYVESFDYDVPPEHAEFTVITLKKLGVELHQEGRTLSYDLTCSKEEVSGIIAGEFIAHSNLGKLTITELFVLATMGVASLEKVAGFTSAREKVVESK